MARSGAHFVAGAALSQGQGLPRFELRGRRSFLARSGALSWQAQHFRKVRYRFRGRHSTFARSSAEFVAGAALSTGRVEIS